MLNQQVAAVLVMSSHATQALAGLLERPPLGWPSPQAVAFTWRALLPVRS